VPLDRVAAHGAVLVAAAHRRVRDGAAVAHGQCLVVRLELAKVVLVRARDRLNVAFVRERKRSPCTIGILTKPRSSWTEFAIVLFFEEFRARLAAKLNVFEEHAALVATLVLALQREFGALVGPLVRVRAGLRRTAAEVFGERREIVDLHVEFTRIVNQPTLEDLSVFRFNNDQTTFANCQCDVSASQTTAIFITIELSKEHISRKHFANFLRFEAWQARVAFRRDGQARGAVTATHVARIVLARREARAVATNARCAVAAAHVARIRARTLAHAARIVLRSAVRHTQTIGTR